jgi:hypothetical protein
MRDGDDLRGPQAWDKRHLDYAVANAEKIAAILPLHFSLSRLILPDRT